MSEELAQIPDSDEDGLAQAEQAADEILQPSYNDLVEQSPKEQEEQEHDRSNHEVDPKWGLQQRELAFVLRFMEHGCGSRAAREAGYGPAGARTRSYQLLRRPRVKKAIAEMRKVALRMARVTAGYVIRNLVAESENFGPGSNSNSRITALSKLGEYLGIFKAGGGSEVQINVPCKVFIGLDANKL